VSKIHILITKIKFSRKRKLEGHFPNTSRAKKCPKAVGRPSLV
jgi:hypothetical protein